MTIITENGSPEDITIEKKIMEAGADAILDYTIEQAKTAVTDKVPEDKIISWAGVLVDDAISETKDEICVEDDSKEFSYMQKRAKLRTKQLKERRDLDKEFSEEDRKAAKAAKAEDRKKLRDELEKELHDTATAQLQGEGKDPKVKGFKTAVRERIKKMKAERRAERKAEKEAARKAAEETKESDRWEKAKAKLIKKGMSHTDKDFGLAVLTQVEEDKAKRRGPRLSTQIKQILFEGAPADTMDPQAIKIFEKIIEKIQIKINALKLANADEIKGELNI
jgi:hypothetical protein